MAYQTIKENPNDQPICDANNLLAQSPLVSRADRERLNGHPGRVIWFTGLSGSGKSTLANALEAALHAKGIKTYILDGDNLRLGLNNDLGFSIADRVENMRRIVAVSQLLLDAGVVVLVASIAPFTAERKKARHQIGTADFVEVYVNTPLEICVTRDVKGLYKKASRAEISNMTGISSPYEVPDRPCYAVPGYGVTVDDTIQKLLGIFNF